MYTPHGTTCHATTSSDTVIIVAKEEWDHKRYFMLMPVASLWTATFPNLYETMLPSMPCHAYLDVDCPAAMHTANFTELLQARCDAVAAPVFSATIHKFVVLTSHAPDGTRLSYHIVCHLQDSSTGRALLFKNNMAAAGFAQRVAQGLPQPSVIDTKVYKPSQRQMRLLGHSKHARPGAAISPGHTPHPR